MGCLGSCACCGANATVEYPLLGVSFCSNHHNAQDAGRYGADFSGPDDFDIPDEIFSEFEDNYIYDETGKEVLVWVTREGEEIEIRNLQTSHILNILRFFKDNYEFLDSRTFKVLNIELQKRKDKIKKIFSE